MEGQAPIRPYELRTSLPRSERVTCSDGLRIVQLGHGMYNGLRLTGIQSPRSKFIMYPYLVMLWGGFGGMSCNSVGTLVGPSLLCESDCGHDADASPFCAASMYAMGRLVMVGFRACTSEESCIPTLPLSSSADFHPKGHKTWWGKG